MEKQIDIKKFKNQIPENIYDIFIKQGFTYLNPPQYKSIEKGLFNKSHNLLVSSPTGSGKTLIFEMAILNEILNKKGKVIYVVPLKALASQLYFDFKKKYETLFKIRIAVSDITEKRFSYDFDILFLTCEKLDSVIRNKIETLKGVKLICIDEIHLLDDISRGPTLEILISLFLSKYNEIRLIGLSATIQNSNELAKWMRAELVIDNFRATELKHYILFENNLINYK